MDLYDYENADTISIDTLALEEIIQEERAREISELNSLSKKMYFLHTSVLYYRNAKSKIGCNCYEAWRILVKKVGGTPNGWRDLGYALAIPQDDLDYIMNMVNEDPVDTVLKLFRQYEKATLDKIVDAFIKMKRYDILKALEVPFTNLAQCFNKDDSGYHSNTRNSGEREIISFMKNLTDDLPPALSKNIIIKKPEPNRPNQPLKFPPKKVDKEIKNDSPILFLTYAEDGFQTAINIQNYVEDWTDMPHVTVITLNDRRTDVFQNPEKFIREYFEKADYIVPIITPGYLNEIRSPNNTGVPNTDDNLDYKYVNFIYNLIFNHYVLANGCINKKVRSVLPENPDMSVFSDIMFYPVLTPWTNEANFNEHFKSFLEKEYS